MTLGFFRGFREAFCSPVTVGSTALLTMFLMFETGFLPPSKGANGWDLLLATLSEAKSIALVGIIWWYLMLVPVLRDPLREQRLIRYGTQTRALLGHLGVMTGKLFGGVTQLSLVSVGVLLGLGYSLQPVWSSWAGEASGPELMSAYESRAFVDAFGGPLPAMLLVAVFAGLGMLSTGSLAIAISVKGYSMAALLGYGAFTLWTMWCSFSVAVSPFIDTAALMTFAWARTTPGATRIAILWWLVCLLAASWITWRSPRRIRVRDVWSSRWGSLASLWLIAALGVLLSSKTESNETSAITRGFFAGPYGDILTATVPVLIAVGFATAFLARLVNDDDAFRLYRALRVGSYRRLLGQSLFREGAYTFVLVGGVGVMLLSAEVSRGQPLLTSLGDASLWGSLSGLLASTFCLTAIVALLTWSPFPSATSWLTIVGAVLVSGLFAPTGAFADLNIISPYAIDPGVPGGTAHSMAVVVTLVVAVSLGAAALIRAAPRHADHLMYS
ncbi:hypothetical protein [Leucobacter chinensis]|uniref:hypothetical protein n=1 Tax=Leucobacter chinensis TaxID=2851010 RepID=UPI001C21C2B2|nr:hypothetical protein [Leucobacter chinensis]